MAVPHATNWAEYPALSNRKILVDQMVFLKSQFSGRPIPFQHVRVFVVHISNNKTVNLVWPKKIIWIIYDKIYLKLTRDPN